jgi:uncharacterized protein
MVETIAVGPIEKGERIQGLDVLRGVAVLGILLMNIPLMGLLGDRPLPALPALTNADWIAYTVQDVVFAGSMRGLFTLLFGAGMLIMLRRADDPENGGASFQAYLTRCFALVLLGVANFAIFLWPGEILFNYGVVGFLLLLFRKAKPRLLWTAAIASLVILTVSAVIPRLERADALRQAQVAAVLKAEGKALTHEQKASLDILDKVNAVYHPKPEALEKQRVERTHFPGVLSWSAKLWQQINLQADGLWGLLETLGFMLIGLALYRSGILTGERPLAFYGGLALVGYGIGLVIRGGFSAWEWSTGFEPNPNQMIWRILLYEAGRLPTTLGLLGLITFLHKSGALGRMAGVLQAIGRMALTNYVGQSVITSVIFYAFGLVGRLGFAQLMAVAVAIWIVQAVFSVLWLHRFSMGPLEWLLRSLTYGAWRPGNRTNPSVRAQT